VLSDCTYDHRGVKNCEQGHWTVRDASNIVEFLVSGITPTGLYFEPDAIISYGYTDQLRVSLRDLDQTISSDSHHDRQFDWQLPWNRKHLIVFGPRIGNLLSNSYGPTGGQDVHDPLTYIDECGCIASASDNVYNVPPNAMTWHMISFLSQDQQSNKSCSCSDL
jgi:hypothetical protein